MNHARHSKHHVSSAEFGNNSGRVSQHRLPFGDIDSVRAHPRAVWAKLRRRRDRLVIPVRQRQLRALPSQSDSQRPADTRARSRHHRHPPGVIPHARLLLARPADRTQPLIPPHPTPRTPDHTSAEASSSRPATWQPVRG
jgi:hypothetical protein